MIYYEGEFTARIEGKDVPAMLKIYTEDTGIPQPLIFSAEPVTITWDDAGITDVIHRSQLEARLIATEDGQYRDIIGQQSPVWCHLLIMKEGQYVRWWSGAYASATLSEPFSTEKNYEVSITFSDFGILERKAYDGACDTSNGIVGISDIFVHILSSFLEDSYVGIIKVHNLLSANIGEDGILDQMVRDKIFYEDDGSPRYMLDIVTDILEPTNTHIMQYDGEVHLFCPDCFTAEEVGDAVSRSMISGGTDAELETCERWRRVDLDYPSDTDALYEFTPDMDDYVYSGDYADISKDGDSSAVLAIGNTYAAPGSFYTMAGGEGLSASMILLMNVGLSWPGGSRPGGPESIGGIRYSFPETRICVSTSNVIVPSSASHRIRIDIDIFAVFTHSGDFGLYLIELPVVVKFIDSNGSVSYLKENTSIFSPSRYSWSTQEASASAFLQTETPDKNKYGQYTLSLYIPNPEGIGVVEVSYSPTSFRFMDSSKPLGESGNEFRTSTVNAIGLVGIKATAIGYFDSELLNKGNGIHEDFYDADTDADVFSREFKMGTPLMSSIGTTNNIMGHGDITWESAFITRYAAFIRRNAGLVQPRMEIHGTYIFNHLLGLAVFIPEHSIPLRTLSGRNSAFFIKSESWNIKSGLSELSLEEFSVEEYSPYPDYSSIVAIPSELNLDALGTAVTAVIRAEGTSWNLAAGPHADVIPVSGGEGDTTITVSMDENTDIAKRTSYIYIRKGASSVEYARITLAQEGAELYVTLNSKVIQVPWGTQPEPVGVQSNAETFEVSTSNAKVHAEMSEDNSQLLISVDEGDGGRDDLGIIAIVNVTGRADGHSDVTASLTVVRNSPGFILEATKPTVSIPRLTLIGLKYSVEFRTNGVSPLRITAGGTLMQHNDLYLYKKNANDDSYVSVKKLEKGENEIAFSDNTADRLVYFSIMNATTIVANTDPIQRAAAFSVKVSAPDEEDKTIALMMTQEVN